MSALLTRIQLIISVCDQLDYQLNFLVDISSIDFRSEQAKNDSAGRVEVLSKEYQKNAFRQRKKSEKNIRHKKEQMEKQGVRLEEKSLARVEAGFFRATPLLIQ